MSSSTLPQDSIVQVLSADNERLRAELARSKARNRKLRARLGQADQPAEASDDAPPPPPDGPAADGVPEPAPAAAAPNPRLTVRRADARDPDWMRANQAALARACAAGAVDFVD
jgi:hypothetical protein